MYRYTYVCAFAYTREFIREARARETRKSALNKLTFGMGREKRGARGAFAAIRVILAAAVAAAAVGTCSLSESSGIAACVCVRVLQKADCEIGGARVCGKGFKVFQEPDG